MAQLLAVAAGSQLVSSAPRGLQGGKGGISASAGFRGLWAKGEHSREMEIQTLPLKQWKLLGTVVPAGGI